MLHMFEECDQNVLRIGFSNFLIDFLLILFSTNLMREYGIPIYLAMFAGHKACLGRNGKYECRVVLRTQISFLSLGGVSCSPTVDFKQYKHLVLICSKFQRNQSLVSTFSTTMIIVCTTYSNFQKPSQFSPQSLFMTFS
jgi:hypothetical protein